MVYSSKFTQTSPIPQFFWHYPQCNKFWVRPLALSSAFSNPGVHLMSHHSKWSLAIILNDLYCSFSLYSTSLHSAEIPNYLDFSLEFRIEAKSNLWKLASKRKTNRSWRHDGKYHLVLVWIFTDLVFFSLFIVKARRWLAQINATVPSPSSPNIASLKWSEGMMARRSNCVIYETLFSTTIIPTTINKDLLVHDVSSARLKRHVTL